MLKGLLIWFLMKYCFVLDRKRACCVMYWSSVWLPLHITFFCSTWIETELASGRPYNTRRHELGLWLVLFSQATYNIINMGYDYKASLLFQTLSVIRMAAAVEENSSWRRMTY